MRKVNRAFTESKALACKCEKSHPPAPFQRENRASEGEKRIWGFCCGKAAAETPNPGKKQVTL
jgi:hypothetical protein